MTHFVNVVLARAHKHKRLQDAEHHVLCSEWAAVIYKRLGLVLPDLDPRLVAPVNPLLKSDLFAEPLLLEASGTPAAGFGAGTPAGK